MPSNHPHRPTSILRKPPSSRQNASTNPRPPSTSSPHTPPHLSSRRQRFQLRFEVSAPNGTYTTTKAQRRTRPHAPTTTISAGPGAAVTTDGTAFASQPTVRRSGGGQRVSMCADDGGACDRSQLRRSLSAQACLSSAKARAPDFRSVACCHDARVNDGGGTATLVRTDTERACSTPDVPRRHTSTGPICAPASARGPPDGAHMQLVLSRRRHAQSAVKHNGQPDGASGSGGAGAHVARSRRWSQDPSATVPQVAVSEEGELDGLFTFLEGCSRHVCSFFRKIPGLLAQVPRFTMALLSLAIPPFLRPHATSSAGRRNRVRLQV